MLIMKAIECQLIRMTDNTPRPIELLYEAALQGNVSLLQDLLLRDPFLLRRPLPPSQSNTSPLHVACKLGHTNFVLELLYCNPNLMEEHDPDDKSSVLHLAARNGHLELVKFLISVNPSLCFARDMAGRNPVHLAAIKGQLHVLEGLLRATPAAARERVGLLLGGSGGDTIMHLCVKFNQPEALKLTVRMVGDTQMLNATDGEGNTILHVAVANKNLEIVEFLLKERRLKKSSLNSNGLTAKDVFEEIPKEINNNVDVRLRLALKRGKVLPSKRVIKEEEKEKYLKWIEKQRSTLMIVASLIATMAFQAGVNPPGGVWQDNGPLTTESHDATTLAPSPVSWTDWHDAGKSVMAQVAPKDYREFFKWNTIGFVLSMSSMLLLISGLPCKRFFMGSIMVTMWGAVAVMAYTYVLSTFNLVSGLTNWGELLVARICTISWICTLGLLLIGHFIHWPIRLIKYLRKRKLNTVAT